MAFGIQDVAAVVPGGCVLVVERDRRAVIAESGLRSALDGVNVAAVAECLRAGGIPVDGGREVRQR